jgi:hypothetical protein
MQESWSMPDFSLPDARIVLVKGFKKFHASLSDFGLFRALRLPSTCLAAAHAATPGTIPESACGMHFSR